MSPSSSRSLTSLYAYMGLYFKFECQFGLFSLGQVVRMVVGNMATGHLYSRLIPLVLLLVDGKLHLFCYFRALFIAFYAN